MRVAVGPFGLLLLLTLVQFSQQVTELDRKDYYIGAVVEFAPFVNATNGQQTLQTNVNSYADFAKQAKQQDADIIVFPEDGLTSYHLPPKSAMDPWATAIPSPKEEYVPCTGNRSDVSETLKQLSCAARTNSIYLVANIAEKEGCPDAHAVECTNNRTIYHNTNVAFDRAGKIIARYRKVNLYNEEQFETVQPPEIVTFDTDFGVKFGMFICFDILFPVPALNLTRQLGVRDIVYSTAWFSEAPFLTAVQTQYGWSYGEDVNMLAAGYNNPRVGSAGSGIYLGTNGIAAATITEKSQNRLLVSRVPKKTPKTQDVKLYAEKVPSSDKVVDSCYKMNNTVDNVLGVRIMRDSIQSFETVLLNASSFNETVCHRDFCCDFRGSKASDGNETSSIYRAVVFKGCRFYGRTVEADIRVCAVTQCFDESVASCGVVKPSNVKFNDLEITTTDRNLTRLLALPNALNSSLLPFERWTYSKLLTTENATRYTITLKEPTSDITTFGVYMRDFGQSSSSSGSAELFALSTIVLPILMSTISLLANRR